MLQVVILEVIILIARGTSLAARGQEDLIKRGVIGDEDNVNIRMMSQHFVSRANLDTGRIEGRVTIARASDAERRQCDQ